jgi:hypothetical protein
MASQIDLGTLHANIGRLRRIVEKPACLPLHGAIPGEWKPVFRPELQLGVI